MVSVLMRFRLPQTRAGRLLLPSGYSRWLFWKAAVGRWERSRFQLRTAMAELFPVAGGALAASTVPGKALWHFLGSPFQCFRIQRTQQFRRLAGTLGPGRPSPVHEAVWPNFGAWTLLLIWVLDNSAEICPRMQHASYTPTSPARQ